MVVHKTLAVHVFGSQTMWEHEVTDQEVAATATAYAMCTDNVGKDLVETVMKWSSRTGGRREVKLAGYEEVGHSTGRRGTNAMLVQ